MNQANSTNSHANRESRSQQLSAVFDLYTIARQFKELNNGEHANNPHTFLDYFQRKIEELEITNSCEVLPNQKKLSNEWKSLIKGRITEKYIHSAQLSGMRSNSFLVSKIMGHAVRVTRSETTSQNDLKTKVFRSICQIWPQYNVQPCGLYVKLDCPIFAATVDAISDDYVFKIIVSS